MRPRIIVVLAAVGVLAGTVAGPSGAAPRPGTVYLALGDSLAASVQPTGEVRNGYAEQLSQLEQSRFADLRLVKLGCPGETTRTIDVAKARCPYAEGTQLDQAVAVLERGRVGFVTLHVGSNDAFRCFDFRRGEFDMDCVDEALPQITARLTSIVETLRAADPDVPIVGANYHDPLLALWTARGFPSDAVMANAAVWATVNDTIEAAYAGVDVPVADVAAAFDSAAFTPIVHVRGYGDLPLNVARICQWTYMCPEEFGHDLHPTTFGYAVMTQAFRETLAGVLPG